MSVAVRNSVRKQTLHVTVDSEALAFALQPRLQELNRMFVEIAERIFDEVSTPEQHIRIASVNVDLGTIAAGDIESVSAERFERELQEALRKKLSGSERQPAGESLTQSSQDAQLELVERYLVTGTLPFWTSAGSFSLEESIADLESTHADGLARLFRRHAANARLHRRIVHGLSDEARQGLSRFLAPDDAALIFESANALRVDRGVAPFPPPHAPFGLGPDEPEEPFREPIYIGNAGLILTGPFLPQLFQSLDMLERGEDGKPRLLADQISRAVHLLQWLVDGRTSAPEPLLCLNKILCGVPVPTPIARAIEPTRRELESCQTLLASVNGNWAIIKNTSIPGLQETFLQREGRLDRTSDGWRLFVQRKTIDVLLDQIPWSISTIADAWMNEPVFVTW